MRGSGRLRGMVIKAIVHEAEDGGYWAEVPALPGCVTQGESLDEIKANLRDAIELWLSIDDQFVGLGSTDRCWNSPCETSFG
jgi:predicted RNase H-like HicB family nuclease